MLLGTIGLEACLRFLPVNKGLVRMDPPLRWPLENYRPHSDYSYSKNWSFLHSRYGKSNNYGQLSPFDFKQNEAIVAVVGDSYIEARMNHFKDTLQGQLGEKPGIGMPVYGFGSNGLSIADYLVLSKQIATEFRPKAFVYVLVDNDLSEATVSRKGWHHFDLRNFDWPVFVPEREGNRAWYNDLLASSSLYRYLKGTLGLTMGIPFLSKSGSPSPTADSPPKELKAIEFSAIRKFVQELPKATGRPSPCHIFLLDSDRYALYESKNAVAPIDNPALREAFLAEAARHNLTVVDLAPKFAADFLQAHQYFDFFPVDRHWNRRGHGIAAQAAENALNEISSICNTVADGNIGASVSSPGK